MSNDTTQEKDRIFTDSANDAMDMAQAFYTWSYVGFKVKNPRADAFIRVTAAVRPNILGHDVQEMNNMTEGFIMLDVNPLPCKPETITAQRIAQRFGGDYREYEVLANLLNGAHKHK